MLDPFQSGPRGPVKRYDITSPIATHTRRGTCEEARCVPYRKGFVTTVDESTVLGQMQAHYIREDRTRSRVETRDERGLTVFTFDAGTPCFGEHRVPVDRPELYTVRSGDGAAPFRHKRAADWVDDFATHQDRLATIIERG